MPNLAKSKNALFLILAVIVVIVIFGIIWFLNQEKTAAVYDADTTLNESLTVLSGERILIKNGAVLSINGDLTVDGKLECDNGPLSVIVAGNLTVNGELRCERDEEIADDDIGIGIALVVSGNVEFSQDSVVATNGHFQLVDDEAKLATTEEEIDAIYEDAGADSGEGLRLGPFIEIPLDSSQTLVPAAGDNQTALKQNGFFQGLKNIIIPAASAADPAVDELGRVVPNTVKIGGTWVVGDPAVGPPAEIQVPTPPKKIKKIVIVYDFGGANMNITNLTLYGPDGTTGSEDTNGCNVKGGRGGDAFRLNVIAPNVTINNFTLFLGYGGEGGFAETDEDCNHGQATGGDAGEPSNFKIIGTNQIDIVGKFTINPGQGGRGGQAVAHGKNGQDGCPGENGGQATATGGQGGDNKKGLKVTGAVSGIANIELGDIIAGDGGAADANGGNGGNGTGADCDGGVGGDATANGGPGGVATSRTVPSHGGTGGSASAVPGQGGQGGAGTAKDPGGDGGDGGAAIVNQGKGGSGKTSNGEDGTVFDQTGGNGGNGGDGCNEGKGGKGGAGNPKGEDGKDGKNICPAPAQPAAGVVPGGGAVVPQPAAPQPVNVAPKTVSKKHVIGQSSCPDPLSGVAISGPAGTFQLSGIPQWLTIPVISGSLPAEIPINFNCNISNFTTHDEQARINVSVTTADDQTVNSFFDVFLEIELPE